MEPEIGLLMANLAGMGRLQQGTLLNHTPSSLHPHTATSAFHTDCINRLMLVSPSDVGDRLTSHCPWQHVAACLFWIRSVDLVVYCYQLRTYCDITRIAKLMDGTRTRSYSSVYRLP